MATPAGKGATREHLRLAAKLGNPAALAALAAVPECPDALAYLYERFVELAATRHVTEAGLQPLTHQDVLAYATLTDWHPEPHEVRAVLTLDAVTRHPDTGQDTDA